MINPVNLLGVQISAVDIEGALEQVKACLPNKKGDFFCLSSIHPVMEAIKDPEIKKIISQASAIFPDGMGIAMALRLLGNKFKGRVRGTDLMLKLCLYASKNNLSVSLYGNTNETLSKLRGILEGQFPGIGIVKAISPPFRELSPAEDEAIIEEVNKAKTDIIFVSLGAPKQEEWMARHKGKINAVQIGVGAAFDFIVGNVRQPPLWIQKLPLEWLFRLFQQPAKVIYRMSLVPEFLFRLLMQIIRERLLSVKENI